MKARAKRDTAQTPAFGGMTFHGMKYIDYYAALGLPKDADAGDIKKAYRKLAREHHPDMSKAKGAEARFKDIGAAYATLKDPAKRAAYDGLGSYKEGDEMDPPSGSSSSPSSSSWQSRAGQPQGFSHARSGPHPGGETAFADMDFSDLFAAFGQGGGQAGSQRGGSSQRTPRTARGRDYDNTIAVSLRDAHRGTTMRIQLDEGGGDVRTLEVTIPAGSADGQKLRLRGKGGKGSAGGADGDIYLQIKLGVDPVFRVDGLELYFDLTLAPWEAALGAEIQVSTLDADVMLTVPACSRTGRRLRLKNRGLKKRDGTRGDMYAVVRIDIPSVVTEKEKQLYDELQKLSDFNPRSTTNV